ncbi:MAG: peptidylprolyl isomerase [Alkalinema sp. CACIAM 70d]|nr:MAG: peptidylprolyl isomerase [Alkalinema sp. CACIAM 70d]
MSFWNRLKRQLLVLALACLAWSYWMPSTQALPQGNAITDPKALLRYALPIENPEVRKLQAAIEDISQQLRANRRWGAVVADLNRAERVVADKQAALLDSIPDDRKPQAEALLGDIQAEIGQMQAGLEAKNRQTTLDQRAVLLDKIGSLEELMVQGYPFAVPEEYSNLPQLRGRATVEIKTTQGDVTAVLDGYSAPVTAGNFVDLVQRGFYNNLSFTRSEDFYILQVGDPEGPEVGFVDPKTKKYRAIPLEVLAKGDKEPTYGITLEDAGRPLDQPVLPFSAYGAMALARSDEDPNGGSSQFFFFLFEPELTPAGINLLDGRYAIFGYVVEGNDILRTLKAGTDKIISAKVISGAENLVQPKA